MDFRPVVLVVLDGWGLRDDPKGNAIQQARTPNFSAYQRGYVHTFLRASGTVVGLPEGQMGNSEVGHLTLGAGRLIEQDLTRIQSAVRSGAFTDNSVLQAALEHTRVSGKGLHLCGLLSDGGVHSHIDHMLLLIEMAAEWGLTRVYLHPFLDGRDVPPQSAGKYLEQLGRKCQSCGMGTLSTIMGRMYAMDRDQRWGRTEKAYRAMVYGEGPPFAHPSPDPSMWKDLVFDRTDEFLMPFILDGREEARIRTGDTVIFCNFRNDRIRQLSRALLSGDFSHFDRGSGHPHSLYGVSLTEYDDHFPDHVAFPPLPLERTLGEIISRAGLRQLRVAETEKYPHVTWFFNGRREQAFTGEERILVPSPKVATYDLCPEMSAGEITARFIDRWSQGGIGWAVVNYANPDMVGHSGKLEPTVRAVETVDTCLGELVESVLVRDGVVLVTADHGNAERMLDDFGKPHTAHTTSLVPCIFVGRGFTHGAWQVREGGSLCDIAPTILSLLGLSVPKEMTGRSLLDEPAHGEKEDRS
ncbi:2,3-bisphosphoglycerate-independent phosphoglycerate mutase [Pasteuria penetrans]|uniref:2,3-bisphosphoglycerate-independent phosphoglycerate mutase n=1 Tax=Pasteuria penetrans TaxID=86005 RepID=UPI000F9B7A18